MSYKFNTCMYQWLTINYTFYRTKSKVIITDCGEL